MDRTGISDTAAQLVLSQRMGRLPINPQGLCRGNIRCDSMGNFCTKTRMTYEQISRDGGTQDGLTLLLPDGGYLILFNERRTNPRRRAFTIAHELGHICLGHYQDQPEQEQEANQFAADLLMPRILLWELRRRSRTPLSPTELAGIFAVSTQAAQNQLRSWANRKDAFSESEYLLLKRYRALLP